MKVKSESEVVQSCPTLSDLMDSSLPGSSVHGIFQARVLEWGGHSLKRSQIFYLKFETHGKGESKTSNELFTVKGSYW